MGLQTDIADVKAKLGEVRGNIKVLIELAKRKP